MRCREREGGAGKRKGGRKRGCRQGNGGTGKGGWEGGARAGKRVQGGRKGDAGVLRGFMGRGAEARKGVQEREGGAGKGGSQFPPLPKGEVIKRDFNVKTF